MTLILTENEIAQAALLLKEGNVVAFPTETVYGLGASIFQPDAIARIFQVKGRPQDNPLIAHVSSYEQIQRIAHEIPPIFNLLAEALFPGPLTVVLKRRQDVPSIVSAGLDTIALRMPSHPIARQLIEALGEPIVAPSANISGIPSATRCSHVIDDFDGKIAAVIDGGSTQFGIESTVISLVGPIPVLLRPGAISVERIEQVIQRPVRLACASDLSAPSSPGMKYRHYAPKTPIALFKDSVAMLNALESTQPKMVLSRQPLPFAIPPACHRFALNASDFYSLLRQADANGYAEILIFCDEQTLADPALMNRILKASSYF